MARMKTPKPKITDRELIGMLAELAGNLRNQSPDEQTEARAEELLNVVLPELDRFL
jgi:hypothetical protein